MGISVRFVPVISVQTVPQDSSFKTVRFMPLMDIAPHFIRACQKIVPFGIGNPSDNFAPYPQTLLEYFDQYPNFILTP